MGAKLTIGGDASGGVKAINDLHDMIGKVEKGTALTAKEMQKLEQAAANVVKNNEAPYDKYIRRLADLAKMVDAGTLSMEEAEKTAAKYGAQIDKAGKHGEKAFGSGAMQNIANYTAGMVGVSTAIAAISANLLKTAADAEAAAERARAASGTTGEMSQVSSSPEDRAKQIEFAKNLRRRGIVQDRQASESLTFKMGATGMSDPEKEDVLKLAEKGFISEGNVENVAVGAAKFRDTFGAKEAGSIEGILDKGTKASQSMVTANLATAMQASLDPAKAGASLGISDEELLASMSVLENQSKSVDIAATQLKAFYNAAKQKGLKGKNTDELLASAKALVQTEGSDIKALGSSEAAGAYQTLISDPDKFHKRVAEISAADAENTATTAADYGMQDPQFQSTMAYRRAKGSREVADEEMYATGQNLRSTAREEILQRQRRNHPWVEKSLGWMRDLGDKAEDTFDPSGYGTLSTMTEYEKSQLSPDTHKQIDDYLAAAQKTGERTAQALERIEQNQTRPTPQPHGPAE